MRATSVASTTSTRNNQRAKRAIRKVQFTLLVCGPSGTGKTAFINTLVGEPVETEQYVSTINGKDLVLQTKTVEIDDLDDSQTRLVLTVVDTPGFGEQIDSARDIEMLATEIECRFDEVLAEESRIRRNPRFKDNRVHACLYFVEPTGHGLREIDVVTMRRLSSLVNIVPVIARSDTLTAMELQTAKNQVLEDLRFYDILTYDFGADIDPEAAADDPEYMKLVQAVRDAQPFAVVTSNQVDSAGRPMLHRTHIQGTVDIADPRQTDFELLRETLLSSFMSELKDSTRDVLYEAYRTAKLTDPNAAANRSSLLAPEELAEHANRLKEAQLLRENKTLRDHELQIEREIEEKKRALVERERELREIELRLARERESAALPVHRVQPQAAYGVSSETVSAGDSAAALRQDDDTLSRQTSVPVTTDDEMYDAEEAQSVKRQSFAPALPDSMPGGFVSQPASGQAVPDQAAHQPQQAAPQQAAPQQPVQPVSTARTGPVIAGSAAGSAHSGSALSGPALPSKASIDRGSVPERIQTPVNDPPRSTNPAAAAAVAAAAAAGAIPASGSLESISSTAATTGGTAPPSDAGSVPPRSPNRPLSFAGRTVPLQIKKGSNESLPQ